MLLLPLTGTFDLKQFLTYTKKGSKSNYISSSGRLLKNILQRSGKRGRFKTHEKVGIKQVLEQHDGVLGLSKTKFYFEERKVEQNLANRSPVIRPTTQIA